MSEIGKIERPLAQDFDHKRKLYCVPNVFRLENAPADYITLFERYWDEALESLGRLESAGKADVIFCEFLYDESEGSLKLLESVNGRIMRIIQQKKSEGVRLVPLEQKEIFGPLLDWQNCMGIVTTQEVFSTIHGYYKDLAKKRMDHILEIINAQLGPQKAGILFIKDEDRIRLQFPSDIEVFLVTPPAYDDILRWMRDKMQEMYQKK